MDSSDTPTKPTLEERYAVATGASSLVSEWDSTRPRTVLDLIVASGMNPHRLGVALARLQSEWDASAKPQPMPADQLAQLSATFSKLESGLVAVKVLKDGREATEEVLPIVAAQRQASAWHAHEQGILLQRMKSLPSVRAALVQWAEAKGIADAPHVVSAVLLAWLTRVCPVCHGVRLHVIAGTGRTSSRNCGACRGTGEMKTPHGRDGSRVMGHIAHCRGQAAKATRAKYSHHQDHADPRSPR